VKGKEGERAKVGREKGERAKGESCRSQRFLWPRLAALKIKAQSPKGARVKGKGGERGKGERCSQRFL